MFFVIKEQANKQFIILHTIFGYRFHSNIVLIDIIEISPSLTLLAHPVNTGESTQNPSLTLLIHPVNTGESTQNHAELV